jgi:multiple sugar transport system permease protein
MTNGIARQRKRHGAGFDARRYASCFLGRPARLAVLTLTFALIAFPFYWLATNAFKLPQDYFSQPPVLFPTRGTLQNFTEVFTKYQVGRGLVNSILIASMTTVLTLISGALASYSLTNGILPRRTRRALMLWFLVQRLYPAIVFAVPVFYVISRLRLMDSIWALILMNTSFNIPLAILLLVGFYQDVPREVEEQAVLDGCNLFQRFFYIATPMVAPGLAAVGILTFVFTWNEFLYAAILTIFKAKPLTVIIAGFITDRGLIWGPMAAMGCIVVVPVLLVIWGAQKFFISGLSAGALKE